MKFERTNSGQKGSRIRLALIITGFVLLNLRVVLAQADEDVYFFEIPELPANVALDRYARIVNRDLLYQYDLIRSYRTNEVIGEYSADEALRMLIVNTGLAVTFSDKGNIIIGIYKLNGDGSVIDYGEKRMSRKRGFLATMFGVLFATSQVAGTVAADEQGSSVNAMMEEVLVTAQKKGSGEQLQDVPIAISVFNGDQIEAMHADTVQDVSLHMPNVDLTTVGSVPSTASYFIRGMGTAASVVSTEPAVGTFVDGMYLGIPWGVMMDLFDLEGIEVLRGPQGTLFGRNVTGGAVILRSKMPTGEFGAQVKAGFGSYDRRDFNVAIEGPLSDDTLAGKLTVMYKTRGDVFDNVADQLVPGATSEDLGEYDTLIIRPIISWRPSDQFELNLITEFGDQDTDPAASIVLSDQPSLSNTLFPEVAELDDFDVATDYVATLHGEWNNVILQMNWSWDSSSLKSITGWRKLEQSWALDNDAVPTGVVHIMDDTLVEQEQFSQEFIYNRAFTDRIEYTGGIFYFQQDYTSKEHIQILGGALETWSIGEMKDHSTWGVFSQADINLSEKIILTLGGRYTEEQKDVRLAPHFSGCLGGYSSCDFLKQGDESWSSFMPKVGLQYIISTDANIYLSWNKAERSGGFTLRALAANIPIGPYDQETVSAIEAGLKASFADGRIRANVAIFNNQFDDLQQVVGVKVEDGIGVVQAIANAATATVRGVEIELNALLTDNLMISLASGYTDASYDEFIGLDVDLDGIPDPEKAKDLKFAHVPDDWNHSLSVMYSRSEEVGEFIARTSVSKIGERFAQTNNNILLDGYTLWDASITFNPAMNERLGISFHIKNITNEVTEMNGGASS